MRALVPTCALLFLLAGCGVRLDEPATEPTPRVPPVLPACRLFERPELGAVSGRVSALPLADGSTLFVVASVTVSDESRDNAGFVLPAGASDADCYAAAELVDHAVVDTSALAAGESVTALAPIVAAGKRYLYFDLIRPAPGEPFGVARAGTGIAEWDAASRRFVPSEHLLFAGDQPSYGSAARVEGDTVWVYGCSGGFPDAACSVARVPADSVGDESAYRFYTGGGHFAAASEDAFSMVLAGDPLALDFDPQKQRYLMFYAAPLASTLSVRSGLSPSGPWSEPRELGSCELPDRDAFCASVTLLPSASGIALGYAVATFDAGAAGAAPKSYWTRRIAVQVPSGLP